MDIRELQEAYLKAEQEMQEKKEVYESELAEHLHPNISIEEECELESAIRHETGLLDAENKYYELQDKLINRLFDMYEEVDAIAENVDLDLLKESRHYPETRQRLVKLALKI